VSPFFSRDIEEGIEYAISCVCVFFKKTGPSGSTIHSKASQWSGFRMKSGPIHVNGCPRECAAVSHRWDAGSDGLDGEATTRTADPTGGRGELSPGMGRVSTGTAKLLLRKTNLVR
jgi:hypothetical protein